MEFSDQISAYTQIPNNQPTLGNDKFIATKCNAKYHYKILTCLSIHSNEVLNNIYYRTVPKVRNSVLMTNTLYSDIHLVFILNLRQGHIKTLTVLYFQRFYSNPV